MVKRCVAAGCSNMYSDGVSLFLFLKDHARRQQWIKQVQRTRAEWKRPSEHSVLCSDHFTDDCFEPDTAIASSLGLNKPRRRLKADAVPTVFKRAAPVLRSKGSDRGVTGKRLACEGPGSSSTDPDGSQPRKVRRGAYKKRERARVCLIAIISLSRINVSTNRQLGYVFPYFL